MSETRIFSLTPASPFRLDYTVWALRRRHENRIDRWDGRTYTRAMVIGETPVLVSVLQTGMDDYPELRVSVQGVKGLTGEVRQGVSDTVTRLLGTDRDLSEFYCVAGRDTRLGPLAERFRGLKPPCFSTVFEALVNAVACQQLSLAVGILLMNRLAEACGVPVAIEGGPPAYAFPRPSDILRMDRDDLRRMGFSRQKGTYLLELARVASSPPDGTGPTGEGAPLDLEGLRLLENEEARGRLSSLKGVGRWSAEYVLLRGLGRLDVFPGDDVGGRKELTDWLGLPRNLDYGHVRRAVSPWNPFAGFVYIHLLLKDLSERGYLQTGASV